MTVVERYERYIGIIEEHQKALKTELAELSVNDLTKEERKYMNDLMGFIGYCNTSISCAEHDIERLKRQENNVEKELRKELGLS